MDQLVAQATMQKETVSKFRVPNDTATAFLSLLEMNSL